MSSNLVKTGDRVRIRVRDSDLVDFRKRVEGRAGTVESVFTRLGARKPQARVWFEPRRRGTKGFAEFVDPEDLVPASRGAGAQRVKKPLKIRRREVGRNSGAPRGMTCGPLPQYQVIDGRRIVFRGETIGQAEDWIAANHPGRAIIRQVAT